jgi:ketosteroid isomerase-like protein
MTTCRKKLDMSDRQAVEDLLEELYAARVGGDLEVIGKLFAEDASFEIAGSNETSPMATLIKGSGRIMRLMQGMISAFELSDFTVVEMLIDGDQAAVRWRATIYHTKSRQVFTTELADFITIANGKVVSFIEFFDTALAAKILAKKKK